MKKSKRIPSKLSLSKKALRDLSQESLRRAAGGSPTILGCTGSGAVTWCGC